MYLPHMHQTRSLVQPNRFVGSNLRLLLSLLLLASAIYAQNDKDAITLKLGKPVERDLAGGQFHSYRVVLTSGQYVYVVAVQRGVDVVVTLFDPNGKQLVEVD